MNFRTAPVNRITRIFACLALLGFGAALIPGGLLPSILLGSALIVASLSLLGREGWQAFQARRQRPDKYDLSELRNIEGYRGPSRDEPSAPQEKKEPDWESEPEDTVYCHRCDVSMPSTLAICPKCGGFLHR